MTTGLMALAAATAALSLSRAQMRQGRRVEASSEIVQIEQKQSMLTAVVGRLDEITQAVEHMLRSLNKKDATASQIVATVGRARDEFASTSEMLRGLSMVAPAPVRPTLADVLAAMRVVVRELSTKTQRLTEANVEDLIMRDRAPLVAQIGALLDATDACRRVCDGQADEFKAEIVRLRRVASP